MACVNGLNQNQVSLPLHCNARPALLNLKDGSISFLPHQPTRNEPNMDLHSLNPHIPRNEYSLIRYPYLVASHPYGRDSTMIQSPHPLTNPLPGRDSRMIQGLNSLTNPLYRREFRMIQGAHPLTNHLPVSVPNMLHNENTPQYQLFPGDDKKIQEFHLPTNQQLTNGSNLIQHSHLLQFQMSSNGAQMTENLHPVTNKLSRNELNIQQQPCSLSHQLPAVEIDMNQNSNMTIQKPGKSTRLSLSQNHGLSQVEFNRNQVNYLPAHQQYERESTNCQGLQSIFQRPCKDGLFMVPSRKIIENKSLYPSFTFPEIGFNLNREVSLVLPNLSLANTDLDSNLYPQYSENVHICVVGPPGCGKADLIRTFARNENILIPNGKPFRKVFQQGMVCFRTNLIIDIWHVDDLILAADDLKSHCESTKSVLVLVYSVTQKTTLLTILEWIKFLKRDIVADVPVILVENNTNVESSFDSREFSGVGVQEEYKLDAFYRCSTECIEDVEAVFLFAAHKAFHRKIQSLERWVPRSF